VGSKGVAGCEDPPTWANVAICPLFGRGLPRPVLPIGPPPPKGQVVPLLARNGDVSLTNSVLHETLGRCMYPFSHSVAVYSIRSDSAVFVAGSGSRLEAHVRIEARHLNRTVSTLEMILWEH
jgi:sugar (pentulose or hexulose) kinase